MAPWILILHGRLAGSLGVHQERLKSRRACMPAARKLSIDLFELGVRAAQWTNYKWSTKYSKSTPMLRLFIPRVSTDLLDRACPELLEISLIASGLALGVFVCPYIKYVEKLFAFVSE